MTVWISIGWLLSPPSPITCRHLGDREICIVQIKRSASHYWEYRTAITVDGVPQPIERYDCRDRVRIQSNGKRVRFEANGPGPWICSFFPGASR